MPRRSSSSESSSIQAHRSRRSGRRSRSRDTRTRRRSSSSSKISSSRSRRSSVSPSAKSAYKRRSRSRSLSSRKSSKTSEGSRHRNVKGDKRDDEIDIKSKMDKALKAAADADAQLREKGVVIPQSCKDWGRFASTSDSSSKQEEPKLTPSQQKSRAKVLDELNNDSFRQQSFKSTAKSSKDSKKSDQSKSKIIDESFVPKPNPNLLKDIASKQFAHECLYEDMEGRRIGWIKTLIAERERIWGVKTILSE